VNAGFLDKRVLLHESRRDSNDPVGDALSPWSVAAHIDNQGSAGDRVISHVVTIRYHPQVTVDTVAVFGTRNLFVRSVQNVNEDNDEMRLICEEIVP